LIVKAKWDIVKRDKRNRCPESEIQQAAEKVEKERSERRRVAFSVTRQAVKNTALQM
jgi:hypothetical protein